MPRVISSVLSPTRFPERRLPGLCTHSCLFRNVWKLCCNWCCGLRNVKDVGGCQGPVGGARKIVARIMSSLGSGNEARLAMRARGTKNYGYTIYVYTCTGIWAGRRCMTRSRSPNNYIPCQIMHSDWCFASNQNAPIFPDHREFYIPEVILHVHIKATGSNFFSVSVSRSWLSRTSSACLSVVVVQNFIGVSLSRGRPVPQNFIGVSLGRGRPVPQNFIGVSLGRGRPVPQNFIGVSLGRGCPELHRRVSRSWLSRTSSACLSVVVVQNFIGVSLGRGRPVPQNFISVSLYSWLPVPRP